MIGCKMMRTLVSVEFESIVILGLPCFLSSSSSRACFLESLVDQCRYGSSMLVPFPEDPYEAIKQACLLETDTESEPFEDPVETETPKSPHTIASPTLRPDSTPPICHAEETEDSDTSDMRSTTARMTLRVLPAMSPGLSASIVELVEDDDEEDEEEEDEEIEESSNFDSESEDAEDEGLTAEDRGPAAGDEGLAARDEGPVMRVKSLGLGGDEAIHEGQQRAAPVMETVIGQGFRSVPEPERLERVSALRQPTLTTWIDPEDAPSIIPSPISSPTIPLTVPSPIASPATVKTEGFLTELGAQVKMQGELIHDHTVRLGEPSPTLFERYDRDIGELFTRSGAVRDEIFSQRYQLRSLEHEQESVAVTLGAFWRPIENRELRLQITEERRARLDLAEIVASMRRGQEPRGDV
ncbi:hypothetical protein Tco_1037159 [Tanacetum coccineum]